MPYEKVILEAPLGFLRRENEVLLARKTRHIGVGCFNGYGGGIEKWESREEAMIRELFKEAVVVAGPKDLEKVAEVFFHNVKTDGTTFVCRCHVYYLWHWKGIPRETPEMADPTWFALDRLPFQEMMLADPMWLPQTFNGKKIIAEVPYGPFQKELSGPVRIREVDHF